jgi:hypothetical protein
MYARHRLSGIDIDVANAGMSMRRPQHEAAELARDGDVVYLAACSAHEIGIFLARYGLPDAEFSHCSPLLPFVFVVML